MNPLPISALLLARDEAGRLDRLLPALAFCREVVVVVDAATRDDSRGVAERHGARVFVRPLDGFGEQRAFALSCCREEWVLWIDADEALPEGGAGRIAQVLAQNEISGWRLARRTWFLGRPIRWCGWQGEKVLRLFRRERARFDDAQVHEAVHVEGVIQDLDVRLEHMSYESWSDCRTKLFAYATANAARARAAGRRASILDVLLRPPLRFARMYVFQLGFLDGARGALVCALAATQVLLKYAELWTLSGPGRRR